MESEHDRGGHTRAGLLPACLLIVGAVLFAATVSADGPPAGVDPEAWAGIQNQIEVERHKIVESDRPGRLYRADNPTQRFTAHFGAEDVVLVPRGRGEPAWQVNMRLTAWGAAHDLQPVPPAGAIAEDNRIEYRRGPLTEWYVNTTMGLEQGFTIEAPPADDIAELVLEMTIDTDLTAELAENGKAVTFHHEHSTMLLTYSGLKAWDAVDAPLEARMELAGDGMRLRLLIDVVGTAWPIFVDPVFTQVAQLLPTPHLDTSDANFGRCVAVDGETMIVGSNDWVHGEYSGAGHVFVRDPGGSGAWIHLKKLEAPYGAPFDYFGISVSISGDTVVVGASGDDENGEDSGAAYVFGRDQGGPDSWGQIVKIIALDGSPHDHFGGSVAIDDQTIAVGAPYIDAGATYVFGMDHGGPGTWGQTAKITAADGESGDAFGLRVATSGDTIVVGAPQDDDNGSRSGSAYIFERNVGGSGLWEQSAKLTASDGAIFHVFGFSVSIQDDIAVIGAPSDDFVGDNTGSAYVFERDQGGAGTWGEVTKLTAPDPDGYDFFGCSIAISDTTALIGAYGDFGSTGAAHLFRRDQGGPDVWGHVAELTADSGYYGAEFGRSVAIDGSTAVVGKPTGSGRTYVFQQDHGGPNAWGQETYISCQPVFTADHDSFGRSVSISGDTAVVGTPSDDSIVGTSGSVYVIQRDQGEPGAWEKIAKIAAEDSGHGGFSSAVAIDGDRIIVGAPADDLNGTESGSAYIFERDFGGTGAWGQVIKIVPGDGGEYDRFGSVSVSGDTVVIGAHSDNVNGDYSGSAYVFQRDHGGPGAWGEVIKIIPADGEEGDRFGSSVSICGDTAVIGAGGDDDFGYNSGAAYVLQRDQGGTNSWGQIAKLSTPNGGQFGISVSIDNNTVIVGSPTDHSDDHRGAAYVFQRDQGGSIGWGQVARIAPSDGDWNFYFGRSVSISDDKAVIGTNPNSTSSNNFGSAYIFHRDQGGPDGWGQVGKIVTPSGDLDDDFGRSVAFDGGTAIVGAPESDILSVGAGAAFIFEISDAFFADDFETGDISGWSATVP